MLIATCYGCTLYYFYAFSGTNLLKRSRVPVPCFLLFLVSENSARKISSKSGEIFSSEHITSGSFRKTEDHLGGGPRGPHPMGARPGVGPRPARVWWPWLAPGSHPSPIYSPRRVNANMKDYNPRKVPSRPSSSISDRRSSEALTGTLPEGRSSPEASTPPCLPPE